MNATVASTDEIFLLLLVTNTGYKESLFRPNRAKNIHVGSIYRFLSVTNNVRSALKPWTKIPGPSSLPVIGQTLHFLPGKPLYGCSGYELHHHLYSNYGPIVKMDIGFGRKPFLYLFDAESCARVLRGENLMPTRPTPDSLAYFRSHYSNIKPDSNRLTGLVTDQGKKWKTLRSMVNPIVLPPKTIKPYHPVIEEVTNEAILRLRSIRNKQNMIERIDEEIKLLSLEAIGVVALGRRLYCFNSDLSESSPARRIISVIKDKLEIADKLNFKPSLWKYIPTPMFKKAMKLYKEEEELLEYFIKTAREEINIKELKNPEDRSILENLIALDESIAVFMAGDLLLGGIDTISSSLTSTLYLLGKNPDKQEKLREEIYKGETTSYLKAVVKEAMRMLPATQGTSRITSTDYNVLGYNIPKDTQVVFGHQLMSMMEDHYPRPKEFLPERWLVDKNDPLSYGNAHPFATNPYGFGTRTCIGRRLANMELEIIVKRFIEAFRIEWVGADPKYLLKTINCMLPPYDFVFHDV